MQKNFLCVWFCYWLAITILPVKSIYMATGEAFIMQLFFVIFVLTAFNWINIVFVPKEIPHAVDFCIPRALFLSKLALALSVCGLLFLIYDKIYIQGIDYSSGLAVAREQWRVLGEERAGQASSMFSVLGYLFGSTYYVAAVLAVTQTQALSNVQRISILFSCFILVILNSVITGGRSNILLFGVFVVAALASRKGLSLLNLMRTRKQRWIIFFAVALAIWYAMFIFYQRADASDLTAREYLLDFLPFLGLEPIDWYRDIPGDGILSSLSSIALLSASYITHSFATTAAIIDGPGEDKTIVFVHLINILSKAGLSSPTASDDWFLAGRFPSFPGALWHQFGWMGFVMGSLLLGAASAVAQAWTALRPTRLLPLGVFVMMDVILVLTPLLFAGDFLSFPFVVFSFFLIPLVAGMHRK